ncbi:hypothetical protein [Intestinimonas butyriciproducens]|uniref:Uncharacterized protein n=1 Tax=Intestinimonas butyriciproducens TaxID=1297617 RepID=A0A0S2W1V6_9FIRM|nr:hypothetical protein [Intestinimonas butyriciproducens]ALP93040.1 hypothetical protein IB211_00645 [Intestinimonas butyriciproducens]
MRAPHTYFSTEFHGGTRAVRARLSNLFAAPRRRGRLPLLGLVLLVGALGGLVACHGGSSATMAMDTQYYDDRGSILEIPQITGDRSEAAQAINAALLARKAVYQTYVDDPYRDESWCEVTAWPTTTDRYLNLALVENVYPTYGSDGTLFSWVYDKKARREVTREQALELAGTTEADLREAVAVLLADGELSLPLDPDTFEIRGFRIDADGEVTFYLGGANRDGAEGMDAWYGLYVWSGGTAARMTGAQPVPSEGLDQREPPLWYQWRETGLGPEGGFVTARMDPEILAGADALRSLAPQALGTDGGRLNVSYAYSDVSHAYSDEDLACWCYDIFGSDGTLLAQGRKSWTGGVLSLCFPGEPGPPIYLAGVEIPEAALDFQRQIREELIPQYSGLPPGEEISFLYRGEVLTEAFPPVWGFRAVRQTEKGWAVVNDYYQDQEDRQVMEVNYDLGGLLAYFRGTFRFPASFADPEERFYPELVQRARRLAAGPDGWSMGEMTLAAAVYFPEDASARGYEGVGAYLCPVTLADRPGWEDDAPYAVYLYDIGGRYTYVGNFTREEAGTREALRALAMGYFENWEAGGGGRFLNYVAGTDHYDPQGGFFTSDGLHLSWQTPGSGDGDNLALVFRSTERGLAVYYRYAYERYVATHGGVEPVSVPPGSGCLVELLAGPGDPRERVGERERPLALEGLPPPGTPAENGWYYLAVTSEEWYPISRYVTDYLRILEWLSDGSTFGFY